MPATSEQQLKSLLQGLADLLNSHLNEPVKEQASSVTDTFELAPSECEQPRTSGKTRTVPFALRLPEQLHAQLVLLKDTLPNTSIQKLVLTATEDSVRRLMKEHRVSVPRG
jgi:hypothetical protein